MNHHMNFLNFHGQNLAVTSTNVREFVSGPISAVAVRENVWEPLKLGLISGYKRISDWCKKRNDLSHFEIPRAPFEFPLVLILSPSMLSRLSLLSAFLRTRGTLSLAIRANCILGTWNWAVGTSFLSPMQSESQSMDTRTTVSPTVVDFKESIPLW